MVDHKRLEYKLRQVEDYLRDDLRTFISPSPRRTNKERLNRLLTDLSVTQDFVLDLIIALEE